MKKNIIIVLAVIIIAILLKLFFASIIQFFQARAMRMMPAASVQVEEVKEENVIKSFEAPGRVIAQYRVDVLARIAGYLQKSFFKEGDYVKAGQILFQIEPTEYMNTVNVASANLSNIKSQLEFAEKQLARASELVKQDYIAKARYDELLAQRDALKAQFASAQATYNDTQRNYGYTQVKSPVNGKVGIINVTIGNFVSQTSGPLTTINSTDPIYVTFPLNSNDYNALIEADKDDNKDRKVELYFNDGTKYDIDGIQDFQDNKIEQSTGTVTLRATFKNPNNQLLHGDFVTVKLYSNNAVNVPIVPLTAVQENQAGKYVYKIEADNIPQLVYIKTNGQTGKNWIVTDGISVGDKIVTEGLQKITPGQKVTVVSAEEMAKIKIKEQKKDK